MADSELKVRRMLFILPRLHSNFHPFIDGLIEKNIKIDILVLHGNYEDAAYKTLIWHSSNFRKNNNRTNHNYRFTYFSYLKLKSILKNDYDLVFLRNEPWLYTFIAMFALWRNKQKTILYNQYSLIEESLIKKGYVQLCNKLLKTFSYSTVLHKNFNNIYFDLEDLDQYISL